MLNALSTLLVGELLLPGLLIWKAGHRRNLKDSSRSLLSWLAMLFVPAATGR